MAHHKIFLKDNGEASFVCSACGRTSKRNMEKFLNIDSPLKIKCQCKCGHSYSAQIERRQYIRKKTKLSGKFLTPDQAKKGLMSVVDMSQTGLKMFLNVAPEFNRGEKLMVQFNLDNRQRDLVSREVLVRNIKGKEVGVEFLSPEHYDKLGKYLAFS
jgi:predicted oxidoreductase